MNSKKLSNIFQFRNIVYKPARIISVSFPYAATYNCSPFRAKYLQINMIIRTRTTNMLVKSNSGFGFSSTIPKLIPKQISVETRRTTIVITIYPLRLSNFRYSFCSGVNSLFRNSFASIGQSKNHSLLFPLQNNSFDNLHSEIQYG